MPPSPPKQPADLSTEELLDRLRHLGEGRGEAPALIDQLRARHMSINEIADKTGIARTTAQRWAKKATEA